MSRPYPVHVHLLPDLIPPGALRGGIAVVVDVLRATTVMIRALAAGCTAVIPCLEIDEARRVAADLSSDSILLAGERRGLPMDGFDLGNSPGSFTEERCRGKTLVMTTTNGTRAILASLEADRILVASFGNVWPTVREVAVSGLDLHVVCSGTDGLISWEDTLLAGMLLRGLTQSNDPSGLDFRNDGALIATTASCWIGLTPEGEPDPTLVESLRLGQGGRRVGELGLDADIVESSRVAWCERSAELRRDPTRITLNP